MRIQPQYEAAEELYKTSRIYTRCSSAAQESDSTKGGRGEPSTKSQQDELFRLAETIPCGHITPPDRYCDSGISATKTRLEQRPGISLLLEEVQRGDLVIVWSLERAVRGSFEVAALLRLLAEKGVSVLSKVQFGTTPLRLDGIMAVMWASAMDMANAIDRGQRSETLLRVKRWERENGIWSGHQMSAGRRVQPVLIHGKTVNTVVWDDHECEIMIEMSHRRFDLGEPAGEILADLRARNVRIHNGRLAGGIGKEKLSKKEAKKRQPKWHPRAFARQTWKIMRQLRDLGLTDPRQLHPGTLEPLVAAANQHRSA